MSTVLDEIIGGVREDLEDRRAKHPLEKVQELALSTAPALDAVCALRGDGQTVRIISEVKRSSPSKGISVSYTHL